MHKFRKGDTIIIISGKDKGRKAIVKSCIKNSSSILIEGINIVKRHIKPNPNKGIEGGVIKKELPIDISNIAIFNPFTEKADKLGYKFINNKKVRYFKSNSKIIDNNT